jgi:hypothetical protein
VPRTTASQHWKAGLRINNSAGWPSLPRACYVLAMAKRKEYEWEVIRLQASPAKFIGYIHAPDEATARAAAIKEFAIRPKDQDRLWFGAVDDMRHLHPSGRRRAATK